MNVEEVVSVDAEIILSETLDTELARKVFAKAIEAGYMKMAHTINGTNQKFFWRICVGVFIVGTNQYLQNLMIKDPGSLEKLFPGHRAK